MASIDLDETALYAVAWAGETTSRHWFDVAREYTEKWHHQQLRDATGRPPLYAAHLLGTVLDIFARGFPYALRAVPATDGSAVSVQIDGAVERSWTVRRSGGMWQLYDGRDLSAAAQIRMDAECAWRLWTKALLPQQSRAALNTQGDLRLIEPLVGFTAIMACSRRLGWPLGLTFQMEGAADTASDEEITRRWAMSSARPIVSAAWR